MDDAVRKYRYRRALRMRSRFDSEDDGRWVTTKQNHRVHINEEGTPDKGNPHVIDAMAPAKKASGTKRPKKTEEAVKKAIGAYTTPGRVKQALTKAGYKFEDLDIHGVLGITGEFEIKATGGSIFVKTKKTGVPEIWFKKQTEKPKPKAKYLPKPKKTKPKKKVGEGKSYADRIAERAKLDKEETLKRLPNYSSCKNASDVADRLSCFGYFKSGQRAIDFGNMSKKTAVSTAKAFEDFLKKNPCMIGNIDRVTIVDDRTAGTRTAYSLWGNHIGLNAKYYEDEKVLKENHDLAERTRLHPPNLPVTSTIYHELTHQLDHYMTEKLYDQIEGYVPRCFSTLVMEEVCKKLKINEGKCKADVSLYALTGGDPYYHKEWLAEAYSEFLCSPSPRPIAKEVGRIVKKYMKLVS